MAYRGITLRLPVGSQGFTGTRNPSQAGPGHFVYVDGAELEGGIIRKEGGAEIFADVGNKILAGISWNPAGAGANTVIFDISGDVKKDTGGGTFGTDLVTGLNDVAVPPPLFVTAGGEGVGDTRKLFLFSASNQVHMVPGSSNTMAPIATPPADWSASFPTFGVQHQFRLWGGGNSSDPHRIYYSTIADHEDFTGSGAGTLAIFPGEGDGLVGGISFRGALILFKYPQGIYIVNTQDPTPANWSVTRLTRAVGTLNGHTIVQIDNDVLYVDHVGSIHMLSATQEFGDINTSDLSKIASMAPFMRDEINRTQLRRACGLWYPDKRQAWFGFPLLGSDDNSLRLILGLEQQNEQGGPGLPRFFMSRRDISVSMFLRPDSDGILKPSVTDDVGQLWDLDTEDRNKDGVAYPITFETANTDLSFADQQIATRMKAGQFLEVTSEPRGDWDLTVEVFWDDNLSEVLQYSMGGTGAALGSFILDTDILSSDVVSSKRKRISGSGRRIKLVAENAGLDQDVSLAEFHLSFELMDERVRDS